MPPSGLFTFESAEFVVWKAEEAVSIPEKIDRFDYKLKVSELFSLLEFFDEMLSNFHLDLFF